MLVFIHISKTAGRTIRYILRSSYGIHHCEVQPWHDRRKGPPFSSADLQRLRKIYPTIKSLAGHRVRGYVDLQEDGTEFKYFTFMRHPLKRMASYYQFKVQERGLNEDFADWIEKREWPHNRQTKAIAGEVDVNKAIQIIKDKRIFVGLAENFDESTLMLRELLANDLNISYKRVNVAPKNTIKDDLISNENTRQMLIEANQADIELYDFIIHEYYPRSQREYGPSLEADTAEYQRTRNNSFNDLNLTLSRIKQFVLYKPLLYLNRKGVGVI